MEHKLQDLLYQIYELNMVNGYPPLVQASIEFTYHSTELIGLQANIGVFTPSNQPVNVPPPSQQSKDSCQSLISCQGRLEDIILQLNRQGQEH